MTFGDSIRTCFQKYATFSGRASRSEFWWFVLFCQIIVGVPLELISNQLGTVWTFATLLPIIAVSARRLHDTNRSGWFQIMPYAGMVFLLLSLSGLGFAENLEQSPFLWAGVVLTIGLSILLLVWYATKGTPGPNRFGEDPLGRTDPDVFS